ncbi:ArsR/SmtB family transcription factor [Agilicoccus flavus]|uniref:ArsR/SmtB family transcription factor n=1 Tax=Agilicoccus flavus TaxID=2775968 RepID=UPI001CF67D2E|nr:helix-turn-helix domain-containing protein [Agilicoccus flavus]
MTESEGPSAPYPVDRDALRVLAHPLRSRLLAELRVLGEATATDLARALDTNTGATSYHLRRLADAGLVEDTGHGTGRRRTWAASTADRPLDVDDPDDDDEAGLDWLARDYVAHFAEKAQAWIGARPDYPLEWQEVCGLDDALVQVTDEQLSALRSEIADVLARYRRVGAGNPQARRVTVWTCALPVDPPRRR